MDGELGLLHIALPVLQKRKSTRHILFHKAHYDAGFGRSSRRLSCRFIHCFFFTSILNVDIPFWATFAFETTAVFALIMIILGVLRWLGFGGIVLFAITLFLGISTVTIPYELLPQFWQNWVYPWVPVRLVSGGLREIFYVSGDWFNESSAVFLGGNYRYRFVLSVSSQ